MGHWNSFLPTDKRTHKALEDAYKAGYTSQKYTYNKYN